MKAEEARPHLAAAHASPACSPRHRRTRLTRRGRILPRGARELADGQEAEGARLDPAIEGRSPSPAHLASFAAARLEPVSPRALTAVISTGHRLIHLDLAELVLSTEAQTGSG